MRCLLLLISCIFMIQKTFGLQLSMNTVAVFGGTGKTGSEVVYQALKSNKKVIVLARDPQKMLVPPGSGGDSLGGKLLVDPNLTVIQGSVTDPDAVEKVTKTSPLPESVTT